MKHSVGDHVTIQSKEWYEANKSEDGIVYEKDMDGNPILDDPFPFSTEMASNNFWEEIVKVVEVDEQNRIYRLSNGLEFYGFREDHLCPFYIDRDQENFLN